MIGGRWALGCVNSPPAARGSQEAGFTQPMDLADPCVHDMRKRLKLAPAVCGCMESRNLLPLLYLMSVYYLSTTSVLECVYLLLRNFDRFGIYDPAI